MLPRLKSGSAADVLKLIVDISEAYYDCSDKLDAMIEHEKGKTNGPGNDETP